MGKMIRGALACAMTILVASCGGDTASPAPTETGPAAWDTTEARWDNTNWN